MTREQKIEWLKKATPEELFKKYEQSNIDLCSPYNNDREYSSEWYQLAKKEILKRMSK